jgi:predicted acylesterase/phospholipase RssA
MSVAKLIPAPAPDSIRPAEVLQRHRVFLRQARDASHQAFFFLDLLEVPLGARVREAVADYRPFALYQVRTLVRGVHLPDHYHQLERELAAGSLVVMESRRRELERAAALFRRWRAVFDQLEDLHAVEVDRLRRDLAAFLDDSREENLLARLENHWLPDLLTWLRKNLALLWTSALVLAVATQVDAVSSLLLNEGRTLLFPLALLLTPLAAGRFLPGILRARLGAAPIWDLGGPALRSFRRQALEPGRLIHRWPGGDKGLGREIFKGQMLKLATYAACWLVAFAVLFGLTWLGRLSGSTVTAFLVLSHFYVLLILARAIDFWEFLDPRPVRLILLLGSLLLLFALFAGIGREVVILSLAGTAVAWPFVSRRHRIWLRLVVVLCLLAVAGFTWRGKLTVDHEAWQDAADPWPRLGFKDWPFPAPPGTRAPVVLLAASGGGSRAAVYTGLTLQKLQEERPWIAEQLQAISSVSGGSLASAAYVARLYDAPVPDDPQRRASLRGARLADLSQALERDFLLPTLFGALMPGQTRGAAIEEEWRNGPIELHDQRLSDLSRRWLWDKKRGAPVPPFPIPIFNSSALDGHDVVLSPLVKDLYTRPGLDDEASDPLRNAYREIAEGDEVPTWVYYRDGVYGLEDLLPRFDPPLSSAVRASANFPFGFPLVRLQTPRPLFFSPLAADREKGEMKTVHLTDGGALSNSGMWSLFNLLMQPENRKELLQRRVLLIVVEASRMPTYRRVDQAVNSLWGAIEDQGPVGQRLHREMLDMLALAYGNRIAVVQLDLVPLESYNVFTTWALDHGSLGQLEKSFEKRWQAELKNLDASWQQLTGATPGPLPYIARRRPPLD